MAGPADPAAEYRRLVELNRSRDRFLRTVSHELRPPLASTSRRPSRVDCRMWTRAGGTLVAGSGAGTAAEIGRYDHVRAVAAALAAGPG